MSAMLSEMEYARARREILKRKAECEWEGARGNTIRLASLYFIRTATREQHIRLADCERVALGGREDLTEISPDIVVAAVLGRSTAPGYIERLSQYLAVFGVSDPTRSEAADFIRDVSADYYAITNNMPLQP
jgi:hypothetical protein